MGIEEIQKINTLAKELLKHHIVDSSEDAYLKAEGIVKGEVKGDSGSIPKVDKEDEINKELRMLGLKMNSLYSELVNMQQEFKGFKEEVAYIKRKLQSEAFQRPSRETVADEKAVGGASSEGRESQERQQPAEQPRTAEKKSDIRPRTGDYSEKDVTVEKFFYFGTNKK